MAINYEHLWEYVSAEYKGDPYSVHGPAHWKRVQQNGLLLATRTGADTDVVRLFALFHDSKRENDMTDPEHGARGAAFAASLRGSLFDLDDARFALLHYACTWHTDEDFSADATIGSCWDADRLDLGRVGIIPDENLMSTEFGKIIARAGSIYSFIEGNEAAS